MSGRKIEIDPDLLRQILDNLPTSIFVKDENLNFVYSNNANQALMGKSLEELFGFSDQDFCDPELANGFEANDRKVFQTGMTVINEEIVAPKGGPAMPVLTRKALLTARDGKRYLIGTNSDQTEIKKREEQYRALADTVPVGVMQIEEDGRISFANPLLLKIFKCDVSSLHLGQFRSVLGDARENFPGAAQRFECTVGADEEARRVLVISSGWLDLNNGNARSALVSFVDISENTELRRFNEEILRLNRELAQNMQQLKDAQDALVRKGRMEQLGQMIATIAHELRNPLSAVRTSAFLMERKIKDKGLGLESQLQRIANGVVRCDTIISELLDVSRSRPLECKLVDLDLWLEGVASEECRKLPAVVEVSCELGLQGKKIPFDPGRMSRALINMLSNATEAMVGKGGEEFKGQGDQARIKVRTYQAEEHVFLEVSDNGPGIPPEMLDKIREPLFTTKQFGTGLGIAAIEQIAMLHGGSLSITSVVGLGTSFAVKIPAEASREEAA
jgi:PAS domain S-box-containing protein